MKLFVVYDRLWGWVFYLQAREKEEKKLKAKQKEAARLQVATSSSNEFGTETLN